MARYFAVVTLACLLLCVGSLHAEVPASQPGEQGALAVEQVSDDSPSLPEVIVSTWHSVVNAAQARDLKAVNNGVIELEKLKLQADVRALDSYALQLVQLGNEALRAGDRETGAFYARKALQLSPSSPVVLARSLPLVRQTGTASTTQQVLKIVKSLWHHPNVALRVLKNSIYPALLACTFGILCALALSFAFKIETLFRGVSRFMPPTVRGLVTPLALLVCLVAPLFAGPLWAVALWAIILYVFIPQHRWLGFAAGTLLVLWGTVVPIRESLRSWLEDPGVQAMLDVASGVFSTSDKSRLVALSIQRPNDGALFYTLGQVLRRHGEYDKAEEAFLRAEMLLGKQPWTPAQRGAIAFLDNKLEKSDRLFHQAEERGLASSAFYFNYSKAKFEMMDTAAAQEFLRKASQKDHVFTQLLQNREQLLGSQGRLAIAEIQLPFHLVLDSALHPTSSIQRNYLTISDALMPGLAPPHICMVGVLVMLSFFFARKRKSRTVPLSSYSNLLPARLLNKILVLIPGGAWIRVERPIWCFFILSLCAMLAMPLIEWPAESHFVVDAFPELMPYYVCFVSLFALCAAYIGAHLEEE
ncbi:MAG: tetratricopeptide repeat protein [Deltaproteobacteria bacterium]|nr:tetratricopeptide repeat protein [Deltaproteobacteria bacterium]